MVCVLGQGKSAIGLVCPAHLRLSHTKCWSLCLRVASDECAVVSQLNQRKSVAGFVFDQSANGSLCCQCKLLKNAMPRALIRFLLSL